MTAAFSVLNRSLFCISAGVLLSATTHARAAQTEEAEFSMRIWEERDGLAGATVTAIQQTKDSYLWVGTKRGLARFDGQQVKMFSADTSSLRSDSIETLCADNAGNLWIGTADGLFLAREGRVRDLQCVVSNAQILAVFEDRQRTISAASDKGLFRFERQRQTGCELLPAQKAVAVVSDAADQIWFVAENELFVRRDRRWSKPDGADLNFSGVSAAAASAGSDGVWISVGAQIRRVTSQKAVPIPVEDRASKLSPQSPITALLEDRGGRLWAGTHGGGVFCYTPERGWQRITDRRSRPAGSITSFFEDAEGSIWAGTSGGSLYQIKRRFVAVWALPLRTRESIPHTVCVARDGGVWTGTDGAGVFRYASGAFTRFGTEHGLADSAVAAVFEDRQTNLWIGTSLGLFRFDKGEILSVPLASVEGRSVSAIFEDRNGSVWFGAAGVLIRKRGEQWDEFEFPDRYRRFEVRAIAQDRAGTIWAGMRGGGLFRVVNNKLERSTQLTRPAIMSLYADGKGALWAGTLNSGLYQIKAGKVLHWTTDDGLPGNSIHAIIEDDAENLWVSCNEGIFGLSKLTLERYARGGGELVLPKHLPISEGESENWSAASGQPAAARCADGRLCFPWGRNIVIFDPAAVLPTRQPNVSVEEVLADGLPQPMSAFRTIHVPASAKRVEFRFGSPDFEPISRVKFRYKLGNDDWTLPGTDRAAHYGQLPSGDYQFRVMAGMDGVWKEAANPVLLRVVPRFWQTAWFQVTTPVVVIALIIGIIGYSERARLRRKLQLLEMQDAMERERQRIAQDLHDDVGAGLTEIMLLGELAGHETLPSGSVQTQLSTITQKTRQLATAMDEIVWTVNPKNDSLPNLASYVCDYAREFFQATPVRPRIDMAEDLPIVPLTTQMRHHLFLAAKEALNNIAKHARATEVWLRIGCVKNQFVLSIEDNGVGFDEHRKGGLGNGLGNMRSRLESMGGKVEIISRPQEGTIIRFQVPLPSPQ